MEIGHKVYRMDEESQESIEELLCYHDVDPGVTIDVEVWEYKGTIKVRSLSYGDDIDYLVVSDLNNTFPDRMKEG